MKRERSALNIRDNLSKGFKKEKKGSSLAGIYD